MNFSFLFLDENDTSGESNVFYCAEGGKITVQATKVGTTTLDLSIQGITDVENGEFTDLALVNLSSGETAASIDDEGLFRVDLSGIAQIKVKNNGTAGNCKVFGIITSR